MRSTKPRHSIRAISESDATQRRALLSGMVALTALSACAPRPSGNARPSGAAEGNLVEVRGTDLYFERFGSGPPIVLLHGASGNLRDWTLGPAQAFAQNRTVIAFDRPGHGLSGWPDQGGETLQVQATLMREAVAALGYERVTLVGHSYGGSVALAWAVDAPESVSGLLLLAAPSQAWEGGLGLRTSLLANPIAGNVIANVAPRIMTDSFVDSVVDGVFAPQAAPDNYAAHLDRNLFLHPDALRRNALQLSNLKSEIRRMEPRYGMLQMPTVLLHGTADQTVPIDIHSEPLARHIPNASLQPLNGVGHMLHHSALAAVVEAAERLPTK